VLAKRETFTFHFGIPVPSMADFCSQQQEKTVQNAFKKGGSGHTAACRADSPRKTYTVICVS
jgi:hypothetical protein